MVPRERKSLARRRSISADVRKDEDEDDDHGDRKSAGVCSIVEDIHEWENGGVTEDVVDVVDGEEEGD